MKKNFYYLSLILGLVLGMTMFTACGGDDDDNGGGASGGNTPIASIVGTWSGEDKIERTGSTRTLIVTFKSDMTGDFTYESNAYYRYAAFTYSISGNTINCKGVIAGEDGNVNEDWSQSFTYNGTTLTPIDAYSEIILYKDGYTNNSSSNSGSGNSGGGSSSGSGDSSANTVYIINDNEIRVGVNDYENGWYGYVLQFGFGVESDEAYNSGMTQIRLTLWADNGTFEPLNYSTSTYGKKKTFTLNLSPYDKEWFNLIGIQSKDSKLYLNYELDYYTTTDGKWHNIKSKKLTINK